MSFFEAQFFFSTLSFSNTQRTRGNVYPCLSPTHRGDVSRVSLALNHSLSLSNTQTRWKTLSSSNNLLFLLIISHSFLFLPFHIILLHLSLHRFPSVSSSSSYLFPTLPFLTKKKRKKRKNVSFSYSTLVPVSFVHVSSVYEISTCTLLYDVCRFIAPRLSYNALHT